MSAAVDGPAYIAHGFAFAMIAYRGAPNYKLPTMIEDAKCAIRYFRARAGSYNINPDRIGLIGPSSGGYIVTMVGLTDPSAGFEGSGAFDGVSSRVQAVVALYPQVSFELPSYSAGEVQSRDEALPPNSSPQLRHAVSLDNYVTKNAPPFLFFHGEFDAALSPGASLELHAKLASAGVGSTYVLVKRAGHGWQPNNPLQLPKTPYGPEPTVAEITRMQLEFFDRHLK
jgi:acetyl esterase/lipase